MGALRDEWERVNDAVPTGSFNNEVYVAGLAMIDRINVLEMALKEIVANGSPAARAIAREALNG